MGEVGEVIPEKSTTTETVTTLTSATAATRPNNLTNGDIQNGVCKPNNVDGGGGGGETDGDTNMDVDTEDDSQISSSENGISETTSDGISNLKRDLLKTDSFQQKKLIIDEKSKSSIENDTDSKSRTPDIHFDEQKNGSGADKDENSQESEKPTINNENHITIDDEEDDDDKSQGIEAMDVDSQSKTNDDVETTQESKSEENDICKNDEKNNLTAEKTTKQICGDMEVDDNVTGDCKNQDEQKTSDSRIVDVVTKKNVNESTNQNSLDSSSTEFSKTNGDVNSALDKITVNQSAKTTLSDEKGNTSADDVQVIESDDDEDPFKDVPHHNDVIGKNKLDKSKKSGDNNEDDDDDAVIIQSDSDNEESDKNVTKSKIINTATPQPQDDDDCVVIDDDDDDDDAENNQPKKTTPIQNQLTTITDSSLQPSNLSRRSSQRQRKSVVQVRDFAAFDSDDITEIVDDPSTQPPPAKRQKPNIQTSPNSGILNLSSPVGTLTIKDARSLCDQSPKTYLHSFLQSTGVSQAELNAANNSNKQLINNSNNNINSSTACNAAFPVGLRPALAPLSNTQTPKLAPVSNLVNTNANLLPALTDDMFVLEAPSFIVPYIYEKPPSQNLKDIVTKLATEFDLNKLKDIKENSDLDLLQLQSKLKTSDASDDKKEEKKSKKRKKGTNPNDDDAWHESDESTDDEASDDDSLTRTKVIVDKADTADLDAIKSALVPAEQIVNNLSTIKDPLAVTNDSTSGGGTIGIDKIKTENYFESPLGKFFQDIGIGLVQEHVQADILKVQKRRLRKCEAGSEQAAQYEFAINALTKNLNTSKKQNEPFKFNMKRCEFCNFKTESSLVMAQHYETPHLEKNLYKCNFCTFEIRQTQDIIFHMEAVHNTKGRLEKPQSYHQCPNCPFEDNGKSKMMRHQPVCAKKFRPEVNLCPPQDWEAPAKIPRIKPRHGLVGTATAYQAMAAQAAAQKAALATLQQQQQAARNLMAATNAANRNRTNISAGGMGIARQNTNNKAQAIRNVPNNIMNSRGGGVNNAQLQMRQQQQQQQILTQNVVLPNNYQIQGGQLIQVAGSSLAILPNSQNSFPFQSQQKKGGQQPSISITPLPRQTNLSAQNSSSPSSSSSHQSMPINAKPGLKPGQTPSGNKFVICEICDGYIKDLEQLRNHMQWMHKVKIHPKMIYNRPPLNCQKCQFRFFTDQGLERHLLGSHGLVTSSMQEAANKGKDAGRCPVCGRMYQWKLLNHVSRDHNMTLKPAHLSYKCTVCTATFGMYKQFENHVYTAHSTVAKKAMTNDGNKKNNNNSNNHNISSNNSSNQNRNNLSLSGTNDSLLKPLRINDEITIIPQPATKKT